MLPKPYKTQVLFRNGPLHNHVALIETRAEPGEVITLQIAENEHPYRLIDGPALRYAMATGEPSEHLCAGAVYAGAVAAVPQNYN